MSDNSHLMPGQMSHMKTIQQQKNINQYIQPILHSLLALICSHIFGLEGTSGMIILMNIHRKKPQKTKENIKKKPKAHFAHFKHP